MEGLGYVGLGNVFALRLKRLQGSAPVPRAQDPLAEKIAETPPAKPGLTTRGPELEPPRRPDTHSQPVEPPAARPTPESPLSKGPFSGTWQASAGAVFRIEDDGTTASRPSLES
jgi:hypothetical protein